MKHITAIFTFASILHLSAFAAVPLRWTVETSRAQPATFDEFAGATYDLEATLQTYGKPLEVVGDPHLYFQTNGMGSVYWSVPASVSGNVLRATWTPACDVGSRAYNCFIGITGTVYNAAFQLRLRPSPGAVPNELPLPQKVIDFSQVTVLNPPWPSAGTARPLPKYLHYLTFDDPYPDDAAWYYAQPQDFGGCSAVRDGGFLYRNYDFPFDDRAEFVVTMSAGPGRFASVGVANVGTNLTEDLVTSGKWSRYYKCLPGHTVDGINEHGVAVEVNVVDGDPVPPSGGDIHPLAAVRWALDNGTSAGMVASNLASRVSFPSGWTQNLHWLVSDESETWAVEDGHCVVCNAVSELPSPMTNSKVVKRMGISPVRYIYLPSYSGSGTERLVIVSDGGAGITNAWFTNAYRRETNPPWVTDLSEVIAFTNDIFDAWAANPREHFRGQRIDGQPWWQTLHTSVYDLKHRVLRIAVQETDDWYVFTCPPADQSVTIQNKRDLTDRTFVTYEPGDWTPSVVDGVWYSPQYYGEGWSVEKYLWYDEWGEWYWEDSEWIYDDEDATVLVAHKLWSGEEITLTRTQVPVEDNLALESQIGSVAQSAAREYLNGNDLVKWKKVLRTGLPGQWGTGWGNVHWEFASDRRWWTMKVPDFTATVTAGGHVDSNGNDVVSSSITIDGRSYVTDPMRRITRTPVKILTQTEGTNGTERCATATWNSVLVPTGEQSAIDDPDACAYAIRFSIDFQDGLSDVSVLPRRLLAPVVYNDGAYYETLYTMSDFSAEVESATNSSATVKCRYACRARYRPSVSSYTPVTYTNWFTVAISNPSGSYTEITKEYGRVITSNTRNLFWDPSLHATWRIDVTNGCFFSEIVSTNNLTGVR